MEVEQVLLLMVPISFVAMALIEAKWPARAFPPVAHWRKIGVLTFVYASLMNALLPELLPVEWVAQHRLFDLSGLGVLTGVVVGHLLITLATFIWHRLTHAWTPLWRGFHQLHHSSRHLNIFAANMSHPLDLFVYIMLPTFLALFVLGLDPLAALIVGNIGAFNAYFQHWNVNTPTWMAWFAQRPEAHCVHHERDLHAYNYSDLPLWDILFGSYRNPRKWSGQTGFDPPADTRFASMVSFADVNAQTLGSDSRGQRLS